MSLYVHPPHIHTPESRTTLGWDELEVGEAIVLRSGLLVAVLGGLMWKRATGAGAAESIDVGTLVTLGTMAVLEMQAKAPVDGVYANEPIYYGLISSALVFIAVSLLIPRSDPLVMRAWEDRLSGSAGPAPVEASEP